MLEPDVGGAAASAVATGDIGGFASGLGNLFTDIAEDAKIGASTAGAGDMQVELEALVKFYNELGAVHETLHAQMTKVQSQAVEFKGQRAGGMVAGAQKAWQAMAESAGAGGDAASLFGNMRSVDWLVLKYMDAISKAAHHYAEQENMAIAGLGHAAGTGPSSSSSGPSNPGPALPANQPAPRANTGAGLN